MPLQLLIINHICFRQVEIRQAITDKITLLLLVLHHIYVWKITANNNKYNYFSAFCHPPYCLRLANLRQTITDKATLLLQVLNHIVYVWQNQDKEQKPDIVYCQQYAIQWHAEHRQEVTGRLPRASIRHQRCLHQRCILNKTFNVEGRLWKDGGIQVK